LKKKKMKLQQKKLIFWFFPLALIK
jgi:hypothetical protein